MALRCKVGNLAYIVFDQWNPQNIGKLVEIVSPATDWCDPDMPEWACRSREPLTGHHPENWEVCNHKQVDIPDAWLRPISGLPVDEEVSDEVAA